MAISYVDSSEIKDIYNEYMSITSELNKENNNFFGRLIKIPIETKEWIGKNSVIYFTEVAFDKKQYVNFVKDLRSVGAMMKDNVESLNDCLTETFKNEKEKGY